LAGPNVGTAQAGALLRRHDTKVDVVVQVDVALEHSHLNAGEPNVEVLAQQVPLLLQQLGHVRRQGVLWAAHTRIQVRVQVRSVAQESSAISTRVAIDTRVTHMT
jgi:hypothetical protein